MWTDNLQYIPLLKFIKLKCQYMMWEFEIVAKIMSINNKLYIKEVAPEYKGTELEEMAFRSKVLAWKEDN